MRKCLHLSPAWNLWLNAKYMECRICESAWTVMVICGERGFGNSFSLLYTYFLYFDWIKRQHKYNKLLLISMQSQHCLRVGCRLCSIGCILTLSINGARVWYFVFALFLQFSMLSLLGLAHFCNVEMDIFYLRVEHILLCIPAIRHRPRNSIYIPMNIIYQNDKREQAWVIRWVSEREREREYWNKIWWRRGRRSFGVEKLWQQSE